MAIVRRNARFKKNFYEQQTWEQNKRVCGIDEVGRGCLAGPVVAAAVMLEPHVSTRLVKDSKIMTADERLKAFRWIIKHGIFSVSVTHHRMIDSINIYQATKYTMKRALMQLCAIGTTPSLILIDAVPIETALCDVIAFPFGESKSISIAAASIVAKVTRDLLMQHFDTAFPHYGLKSHKGYSTPNHKKMLHELRHSIIHRIHFIDHLSSFHGAVQLSLLDEILEEPIECSPLEK